MKNQTPNAEMDVLSLSTESRDGAVARLTRAAAAVRRGISQWLAPAYPSGAAEDCLPDYSPAAPLLPDLPAAAEVAPVPPVADVATDQSPSPARAVKPRGPHARMTCAVCFGVFGIRRDGLMIDHGYEQRGYTRIGGCGGNFYEPLELSDAGLKHLLADLQAKRDIAARRLQEVREFPAHPRNRYLEADRLADVSGFERRILAVMQMLSDWVPADGQGMPAAPAAPSRSRLPAPVGDLFESV